jgi:glycosyltransferase involved in cell wall biosynthesis
LLTEIAYFKTPRVIMSLFQSNPGRMLFFLDESHPTSGAPWTRISFFAKAASAKGYPVDIIGIFSPKALEQRGIKSISNLNILNLIFKVPLPYPSIFVANLFVSSVISTFVLIGRRPIVAVASFPGGDSVSGFLVACALLRIKTVIDYRDEWENQFIFSAMPSFSRRFYKFIKKIWPGLFYSRASFVSVVTKPFVKALNESGVENVILVPNGASGSSFKPLEGKLDDGLFNIVYSGGIGEYYRLDIVVSSLKKLADRGVRNIRLILVGRETNHAVLDNLLAYAINNGLKNSVIYLGNKSNIKELSKIIASADVGIVPYDDNPLWKNGLPAKFWEYCASGLPVIATVFKDSILADLIQERGIGLTVDPLDVDGLADALEKLSLDKEFRTLAGKRARLLIERDFNRDKISEDFINKVLSA